MSEMEHWRGKLKPLSITLQEFKVIHELESLDEDSFNDWFYKQSKYFLDRDVIWEWITREELSPYELSHFVENEDGTVDAHVLFYNGGCGLEEAITHGIKKLRSRS